MKQFTNLFSALLLIVIMATTIASLTGGEFLPIAGALFGLSVLFGFANRKNQEPVLRAGLLKEIWLPELANRFFDDDSFLSDGKDWTPWVENNAINLQEIGASPNVVKNRSTYPVPATQRTDVPINLPLDDYSTDSTIVRDVEAVSLAYDKRQSVLTDHKRSLQQKIADDGIFNIAPTTNTTDTPVIKTSGAVSALTSNKILTSDDIMKMAIGFDNRKFNKAGRTILVPPTMFWEFVNTDSVLKDQAKRNGAGGSETDTWVTYMGFKIMSRVTTAYYNTALTKLAYGAVPGGTDRQAAIVYIAKESFGRGLGTNEMYAKIKDPDQQGDVINFRQRAIVLPVRQKTLGAIIYSN